MVGGTFGEVQFGADKVLVEVGRIFVAIIRAEDEEVISLVSSRHLVDAHLCFILGAVADSGPAAEDAALEAFLVGELADGVAGIDVDHEGVVCATVGVGGGHNDGVVAIGGEGAGQGVGSLVGGGTIDSPSILAGVGGIGDEGGFGAVLNAGRAFDSHSGNDGALGADLDVVDQKEVTVFAVEVAEGDSEVAGDGGGDESDALAKDGVGRGEGLFVEEGGFSALEEVNSIVVTIVAIAGIEAHGIPSNLVAAGGRHGENGAEDPSIGTKIRHIITTRVVGLGGNGRIIIHIPVETIKAVLHGVPAAEAVGEVGVEGEGLGGGAVQNGDVDGVVVVAEIVVSLGDDLVATSGGEGVGEGGAGCAGLHIAADVPLDVGGIGGGREDALFSGAENSGTLSNHFGSGKGTDADFVDVQAELVGAIVVTEGDVDGASVAGEVDALVDIVPGGNLVGKDSGGGGEVGDGGASGGADVDAVVLSSISGILTADIEREGVTLVVGGEGDSGEDHPVVGSQSCRGIRSGSGATVGACIGVVILRRTVEPVVAVAIGVDEGEVGGHGTIVEVLIPGEGGDLCAQCHGEQHCHRES